MSEITTDEKYESLKKYGFIFDREITHGVGLWTHPNREYLQLTTKSMGSSGFLEVFGFDKDDPTDDFWKLWDNNAVFFKFDTKEELNLLLDLLTR